MTMNDRASFSSPLGQIRYDDTIDHFENGLLRLLALDKESFATWLRMSEQSAAPDLLSRLADGFRAVRPSLGGALVDGPVEPGPLAAAGSVWHPQIAENPGFGVARSSDGSWGWLVRAVAGRWTFETTPPEYEQEYFEGDAKQAGGYGQYAAQAGWRLEKAARQLREIQAATGLGTGRALDLGSGYGYFRASLDAAGFSHEGIEISQHARTVAEGLYGFSTLAGTLDDYGSELADRYQLITLWDVIEHLADPVRLLAQIRSCLVPGGVLAIKTPNLDCPEAQVFGPYYHSLKREHLVYFTPKSLEQAAHLAGLHTVDVSSSSHLLVGFVGSDETTNWAKTGRGADLVAYFSR
jgi:2-polyprenyl-3-methyl-5-hydroxy-6-metoxy-1,4-benzoquinol methylase